MAARIHLPRLLAAIVLVVANAGCAVSGLPPPASVARFVHPPIPSGRGDLGKVTATVGVGSTGTDSPTGQAGFGFDGEGSVSLWLKPSYDLTFSSGSYMTAIEGNYLLTRGSLRLGLLHGFGASAALTPSLKLLFLELTAGLDLQANVGPGVLLVVARASYATVRLGVGNQIPVQPMADVGLSLAWSLRVGPLRLAPELAVMREMPVNPTGGTATWHAAVLLSVSAPIPGTHSGKEPSLAAAEKLP